MKRTPALAVLGLFVLLASFLLSASANAQGDSAKNFNENKAQFMVPLGDLIAEMEKDAQVKITYTDAVKPSDADGHLQEITFARLNHAKSILREKLHLCAILVTVHPYSDDELTRLALEMREPWYEKVGNRPLV